MKKHNVIKFQIRLKIAPKSFWRIIEVPSQYTIARLSYTIMASFCLQGNHLFRFMIKNTNYEFDYDDLYSENPSFYPHGVPPINPSLIKIEELWDYETPLEKNEHIDFLYDYKNNWEFDIKVLEIREMEEGEYSLLPNIIDGEGWGIIEDLVPTKSLIDIRKKNIEINGPVFISSLFDGKKESYDLRFYKPFKNLRSFKTRISNIRKNYEE